MDEQLKYEVIKGLADHPDTGNKDRAALKIGCTRRHINRILAGYRKEGNNAPSNYEDSYTQFSYACKQLGVELESSSIPQARGRVERLNQTLQSRLPIELRLAGITDIDSANAFLPYPQYMINSLSDPHSIIFNDNPKCSKPVHRVTDR